MHFFVCFIWVTCNCAQTDLNYSICGWQQWKKPLVHNSSSTNFFWHCTPDFFHPFFSGTTCHIIINVTDLLRLRHLNKCSNCSFLKFPFPQPANCLKRRPPCTHKPFFLTEKKLFSTSIQNTFSNPKVQSLTTPAGRHLEAKETLYLYTAFL